MVCNNSWPCILMLVEFIMTISYFLLVTTKSNCCHVNFVKNGHLLVLYNHYHNINTAKLMKNLLQCHMLLYKSAM